MFVYVVLKILNQRAMNSALLTICFPVLFSNESHVFTRIEKVYAKNNLKGIELANNYIHRNKSIASPYFFKLNHELEAVENKEISLLNRSTHLSNALSFGQKFEKLANDEFEQILAAKPKSHLDYPSIINIINKLRKVKNVIQNNR